MLLADSVIMSDRPLLETFGFTAKSKREEVERVVRNRIGAIFGRVTNPFEEAVAIWSPLKAGSELATDLGLQNGKLGEEFYTRICAEGLELSQAILLMRLRRREVGLNGVQTDARLAKIAVEFFNRNKPEMAHLMMSFGVSVTVKNEVKYDRIMGCVTGGDIFGLEFYRSLGWFKYDGGRLFGDPVNFADQALICGQFKMETFLVKQVGVEHSDQLDELMEGLHRHAIRMIKHLIFPVEKLALWEEWVVKDWSRLMAIVDHYKFDVSSVLDKVRSMIERNGELEDPLLCLNRVDDLLKRGLTLKSCQAELTKAIELASEGAVKDKLKTFVGK